MADEPRKQTVLADFAGLVTNSDPEDIPAGAAQVQVNVVSLLPGELTTRGGYRAVTFEGGT